MEDIRILVVDDHPLVREGLAEIVRRNSGMTLVGQAADGAGAIEAAHRCRPDVILLDIQLPDMNGLEALQHITSGVPETRVIVLTIYEEQSMVVEAVRLGAIGYLCKTCQPKHLVEAIRRAHQGQPTLPSEALPALLKALQSAGKPAGPPRVDELTERELRILSLVAQGKTNRDTGQALGLTEATVRNQLAVVFQKLHVHNRAQAVARGYDLGWLPGRY